MFTFQFPVLPRTCGWDLTDPNRTVGRAEVAAELKRLVETASSQPVDQATRAELARARALLSVMGMA